MKRARLGARARPGVPGSRVMRPAAQKKFSEDWKKFRSKLRFVTLFESGRIPGSPGKSVFRNCGENGEKCRVSHNPCTKAQNLALAPLLY